MDGSITGFLFTLISLISPLLVFIACCYYLSKQAKADAILLFIGSGITLLISCFYSFLMPYIIKNHNLPYAEVNYYYSVIGVIGLVGGICFGVGLFMLINNRLNANRMLNNKF